MNYTEPITFLRFGEVTYEQLERLYAIVPKLDNFNLESFIRWADSHWMGTGLILGFSGGLEVNLEHWEKL